MSKDQNAESRTLAVLVVDDNVDSAELMAELIRALGHDAEVAIRPQAALDLAARTAFDLALLDLSLPDMDGYELGARLKERVPGISVVIVSGYAAAEDRERTAALGFQAHLAKPVDFASITDLLVKTPQKAR